MYTLRAAGPADLATVVPRTRALNADEGIAIDDHLLSAALARLLAEPALGGVWLIEADQPIGHAVVTFGYDLEFGGRDAYLTELWIDPDHRNRGAGRAALDLLERELRALGVAALHLLVRADNPARRLYERAGFVASPRLFMTRLLDEPRSRGRTSDD